MQISFLGAAGTVTGSKYLLDLGNQKIMVDCGLFQGLKELRLRNWSPLPVRPVDVSSVILTHAHIDHSGYLPLFYKNGFNGDVFCTHGTKDLCDVLLPDSGYLQEEEANFANRHGYSRHHPALALYTVHDALKVLDRFVTYPYHHTVQLDDQTSFSFLPAGHIIGSSCVYLKHKNKTMLFSGDLGRPHDLVMKAPEEPPSVDFLVLESTYGNRVHTAAHPLDELAEVINRTAERGGSVIVPAFAVGRAQSLLYYLYLLKQAKRIPDLPVYLDSPMAVSATNIFKRYHNEHRLDEKEIEGMAKVANYINTSFDSQRIDDGVNPKIIISASGMITGGRILHHVKAYAPDGRNTILFTGYQAAETRGQRILSGEREVKMLGEMVPINAEIASLSNMSAHADSQEMLEWLRGFKRAPEKVFIIHGEKDAALALKELITKELHWQCVVPNYQDTYQLT
jgi:metallo-beta-lactamase family protein